MIHTLRLFKETTTNPEVQGNPKVAVEVVKMSSAPDGTGIGLLTSLCATPDELVYQIDRLIGELEQLKKQARA